MWDVRNHPRSTPVMIREMASNRLRPHLSALLLLGAIGCDSLRRVAEELLDHRPPRQRYVDALGNAGLGTAALAIDWVAAGDRALHEAPLVTSPHEEQGYLTPAGAAAIAL